MFDPFRYPAVLVVAGVCAVTAAAAGQSATPGAGTGAGKSPKASVVVLDFDQMKDSVEAAADTRSGASLVESVKKSGREYTVRLRQSARVSLRVVNTNTALYDIAITDSATDLLTAGNTSQSDVTAFLMPLQAFFPHFSPRSASAIVSSAAKGSEGILVSPPGTAGPDVNNTYDAARQLAAHLDSLQAMIDGPQSIKAIETLARQAIDRMRIRQELGRGPGDSTPEDIAKRFRISILHVDTASRKDTASCLPTSPMARRLHMHRDSAWQWMDSLNNQLVPPRAWMDDPDNESFRKSVEIFRTHSDTIYAQAGQLEDSASKTDKIVAVVTGACSQKASPDTLEVSSSKGRRFFVRVSYRSASDVTRSDSSTVVAVTIMPPPPRPIVTPSVGLSLIYAPHATFPTFATRVPATGGAQGVEIYQQSTQDARISWGVTAGFSWRFLDWNSYDRTHVALWLPELSVGQSSGITGYSLGTALSFGPVKIGAGKIWILHTVLEGQSLREMIPNSGYLMTTPSYGSGNWYVSISVFGTPPFLAPTAK